MNLNSFTIAELLNISADFQSALSKVLEALPRTDKTILLGMGRFPNGACGDASYLLGTYLSDLGIDGFMCVDGRRSKKEGDGEETHAWLQKAGTIIDITSGQFEDAPSPLIVSESSDWHSKFRIASASPANFRLISAERREFLIIYDKVRELLSEPSKGHCEQK